MSYSYYMRLVLQRVSRASVEVEGAVAGAIGNGLLVFLGVAREDRTEDADYLAEKLANLRIFPDDAGKMNRSVLESGGSVLVVSQFTLYGDCRKGRRPSFDEAADPEKARSLYEYFVERIRAAGLTIATGVFQAHMLVSLVNDGPVTLILESKKNG
jgi:D-tyrosyl-tRNA(Tyr) deacylase